MNILIVGGAGYIGTKLADHWDRSNRSMVLADIRAGREEVVKWDVREPAPACLTGASFDLIINLAAVHREPGHEAHEYFETNLRGAAHVLALAEKTGCRKILFTSSIAVYGPVKNPTSESALPQPKTPYGISKLTAEWMHRTWQANSPGRQLVICRPGVVYGPGDPGNILRMVRAIKRGYFAFPGSPAIRKSYAYITGLLKSFDFALERPEPVFLYNYVESPTESLGAMVDHIKTALGKNAPVFSLPLPLLEAAAVALHACFGQRSPIHPARVRKLRTATHIIPQTLAECGFRFPYDFATSLKHWRSLAPEDF
ncbi:MAG: NAD(P)-dependent oxidoreductase [Verrucomicrobiae bacterium]